MDTGLEIASREIMWAIPSWFKVTMYLFFIVSLGVLSKGLYQKLTFVTGKKGVDALKELIPGSNLVPPISQLQLGQFFKTIFLQGKIPRDASVGIFHAMIFYGFIILWIATDLVAIHYDTPFKIFQGTLYIVISFLADVAGVTILLGLALAYNRRYIRRPGYLASTEPNREKFMYMMLANLVIVGYLIEGLRIQGTGMPTGEMNWAPVGWMLASFFNILPLPEMVFAGLYKLLWFFHMTITMVFIASLGHTKFSHIFLIPFSSIITPPKSGGIIQPMNFENENAETFGLGKMSDMTFKNRLDLELCVECGRCTQVCPAMAADKPLNPKTIITKARDLAHKNYGKALTEIDLWAEPIYSASELDSCTTCGACMEECPAHIEHVPIIMEAKRFKVLTLGEIPPTAADAVNKIKIQGNPWGISQDDRFNWAQGMEVPVIETGKKVDYLYYVGCAGSYDDANKVVVKDVVRLLKAAGVSFAVIGKTEKCNGDPIRRFGDEYSFYEIAIENITKLRSYQFDKIVSHCPHCLHTIGKEYGKFEDGKFDVIHHTELLAELIKSGKIKPQKEIKEELTFHDPCYLGRHHGQYDAPREILQAIPGLQIREMEKNKDKSRCCGMGGGNMWYELPEGKHLALNRLEDIGQVTKAKLATGCSFCMINFNSSKGQKPETENLEVQDVATILAKSTL